MLKDVATLKTVLNIIHPAVSRSNIIEQGGHISFDTKFAYGFNDKFIIKHPCEFPNKIAVPEKDLLELIKGINENEVFIEVKDNVLLFKTDTIKAGIKGSTELKLQSIIDSSNECADPWVKLPEDFIEGLSLCSFSTAKDINRGVLNSISVNKDRLTSSDDFRISSFKMKTKVPWKFLLPIESAKELIKLAVIEYRSNTNWLNFRTESDVEFSSRILTGEYPEVEKFFNVKGTSFQFPPELKTAIESLIFFAEGDSDVEKKAKITFSKDNITILADKNISWVEKTIPFKNKGKEFELTVNPIFFNELLKRSDTVVIGKETVLFESGSFRHLMSLPA